MTFYLLPLFTVGRVVLWKVHLPCKFFVSECIQSSKLLPDPFLSSHPGPWPVHAADVHPSSAIEVASITLFSTEPQAPCFPEDMLILYNKRLRMCKEKRKKKSWLKETSGAIGKLGGRWLMESETVVESTFSFIVWRWNNVIPSL